MKKRKITGPKRIQFETAYARVSSKLDSIGKYTSVIDYEYKYQRDYSTQLGY